MKRNPKQKLSPLQKNRLWRIGTLIVLAAFAWLLFAPETGVLSLISQKRELSSIQLKTEELVKDNEQLQKEIDRLQKDSAYLEEVARRDYGLLKSHERVYDFSKQSSNEKE